MSWSDGQRLPVMEWSGRAPAPPVIEAGKGRQRQGARYVSNLNDAVAVVGIDIGKNSFHVVGLDARGAICCARSGRAARLKHALPTCHLV